MKLLHLIFLSQVNWRSVYKMKGELTKPGTRWNILSWTIILKTKTKTKSNSNLTINFLISNTHFKTLFQPLTFCGTNRLLRGKKRLFLMERNDRIR